MRKLASLLLLQALTSGACATHEPLPAVRADLRAAGVVSDPRHVSQLEKAMTDHDIAALLDVDVKAKLPTPLAVARLESACGGYQPNLAAVDAEELAGWAEAVKDHSHITGVHPVTRLLHADTRPTLHSLRLAAARMNCELLLAYLKADSSVDNFTDAAVLYWTGLGLWLVPGNLYEHRTVMQAVLLDCRTGMILATATGDSRQKRAYPLAFKDIQARKLASAAAEKALADVQKAFGRQLQQVVASALSARG